MLAHLKKVQDHNAEVARVQREVCEGRRTPQQTTACAEQILMYEERGTPLMNAPEMRIYMRRHNAFAARANARSKLNQMKARARITILLSSLMSRRLHT